MQHLPQPLPEPTTPHALMHRLLKRLGASSTTAFADMDSAKDILDSGMETEKVIGEDDRERGKKEGGRRRAWRIKDRAHSNSHQPQWPRCKSIEPSFTCRSRRRFSFPGTYVSFVVATSVSSSLPLSPPPDVFRALHATIPFPPPFGCLSNKLSFNHVCAPILIPFIGPFVSKTHLMPNHPIETYPQSLPLILHSLSTLRLPFLPSGYSGGCPTALVPPRSDHTASRKDVAAARSR